MYLTREVMCLLDFHITHTQLHAYSGGRTNPPLLASDGFERVLTKMAAMEVAETHKKQKTLEFVKYVRGTNSRYNWRLKVRNAD